MSQLGGICIVGSLWGSRCRPWGTSGFSCVMSFWGCGSSFCCCGSSVSCGCGVICGGNGWDAWWVVVSSKGSGGSVWVDCDVFIPVRCFLRLSEVALCACCIVAWGAFTHLARQLLKGAATPIKRFQLEGGNSFGIYLLRVKIYAEGHSK